MIAPRTIAVIQARMGSTRLPGKVLVPLGGQSMLACVCRRAARAATLDGLLVATTDQPADAPVVDECRRLGIDVFRGNEQDVLDRYYQAARATGADVLVRITADCPLIDPELIDQVVRAMHRYRPDFASNVLERTYPRGLDTEVVAAATLARAWREAEHPYQRAHVMPYLYQHPELFRLHSVTGPHELGHWRWTVDSPDDLALVRAIFDTMGDDGFSWRDVRRLWEQRPELAQLNRHVRQKSVQEG